MEHYGLMKIRFEPRQHSGTRWEPVPYDNDTWAEERIGEWVVALRLTSQDGHAVVSEMRLLPLKASKDSAPGQWDDDQPIPIGGLRSMHVQDVHVTALLTKAQARLTAMAAEIDPMELEAAKKYGDVYLIHNALIDAGFHNPNAVGVRHPSHKRPGRNGHNYEHYLFYALEYDRRTPESSSPNTDLARALFPNALFPKTVAPQDVDYVERQISGARKRGLLSKNLVDGRASGHLTEKAESMIAELGSRPKPEHLQGG